MKDFKIGDIVICENDGDVDYVYTKGSDYEGEVIGIDGKKIRIKTIKTSRYSNYGDTWVVHAKDFKLKNETIEAEDF